MKKLFLLLAILLAVSPVSVSAQSLAQRLAGHILLQVEQHGEAWYVHPETLQKYYMPDGDAAFTLMRFFSLGISDADLATIPAVADTAEMNNSSSACATHSLANQLKGRILLQVEQNGEAWYIDVPKCRRIYMENGDVALEIMRFLGLGITDVDLQGVPTATDSAAPPNSGNGGTPPPTGDQDVGDLHDTTRQALLDRMNQERTGLGLPALSLSKLISQGAQNQANDMTNREYFDFTTPEGKEFTEWITETGYSYHKIAENLAQTNSNVTNLVSTWQSQSPTSYQNVVDTEHIEVGIGVGEFQGIPIYTVIFAKSLEDFFNEETAALNDLEQVRSEMLTRLNAERASAGLSPLSENSLLEKAAQDHTDDMLGRAFYSHDTPEGKTPHERIADAGYVGQKTAENIAKGQFSVEQVMDDWMNSPSHRANILDPEFTDIGFGLSFGSNANGFETLWAQEFGKPL